MSTYELNRLCLELAIAMSKPGTSSEDIVEIAQTFKNFIQNKTQKDK